MTRVAVIGGGNAALCAAIAAREQGADIVHRGLGTPWGSRTNFLRSGCQTAQKSSMSTHVLPPASIDSSAITSTSCRSWARVAAHCASALLRRGVQPPENTPENPSSSLQSLDELLVSAIVRP